MVYRSPPHRRQAATTVEAAFVYPVMFFLLLGLIVGGLGVFRYQTVACQAREAARYAAVRGSDWQKETNQTPPTQQQIRDNVVVPLATCMDTQKLTVRVQWISGLTGDVQDWDGSSKDPASLKTNGDRVTNRVRVTVTYTWLPELLLTDPLTLQSVSEVPMAF